MDYLIERNPVLYCSSLSVLHQCFRRLEDQTETFQVYPPRALMAGVYEEEKTKVEATLKEEATIFGGISIFVQGTTKQGFEEHVKHAALIHFYGHCRTEVDDILDQGLVLSPPKLSSAMDTASSVDSNDPEKSQYLTLPEIFGLELKRASVVTLVACGSSHQEVKKGDEPLGILSDFCMPAQRP
jgi:hypothetical protein